MKMEGLEASPSPFAPRLHQQRDQLPLRAARVLELVHEHVVVARLEPEPALRELVHPPQQHERALEHVREVERRARVERPPVLLQRDREHPADARAPAPTLRSRANCRTTRSTCGAELERPPSGDAWRPPPRRVVRRVVGMDRRRPCAAPRPGSGNAARSGPASRGSARRSRRRRCCEPLHLRGGTADTADGRTARRR